MPRFHHSIPVDDYVLDVLMPDLVGHDRHPAAFLVYLYLYRQAQRGRWGKVTASLRTIADGTGLSKSAVQTALVRLHRRQLISSRRAYPTATPRHQVLRHWRQLPRGKKR
ncbi:MAG TPA: helix-turn-helix domain-containing protein [Chthoniobacterales bacterium]|nr:helix-turn-helix domain-containing protein [Chthoniobacterales bacterium]